MTLTMLYSVDTNMSIETGTLSPWEMSLNFVKLWGWKEISWIIITIILVYIIHKIATRVKNKEGASWIELLFWIISIIGWFFIMYMVMWEKISSNIFFSIPLLTGSCAGTLTAFLIFFRITNDPEKRQSFSRIISGSMLAIIIFGILIFMGINQQEYGIALLMGSLLGGFLSLIKFNFDNMNRIVENIHREEDEDTEWTPPPV